MVNDSRFFSIFIFGCFIHSNINVVATENINTDKKIIIIGAGAAGIAAASKLYENGFNNVTILEAENRVGGRIYTTKLGNYFIDLGAQWVHGQIDNVVFNMAYPLGLLDASNASYSNIKLFNSSGYLLNNRIDANIERFIDKYFIDGAPEGAETNAQTESEFVEEIYNKEFHHQPEMMAHKSEMIRFLEIMTLTTNSADDWNDVSIQDTDGYIVREGNQNTNWKTGGYGIILDILTKRFPDSKKELPVLNNTILNAEVTSIDYTNSGYGYPIVVTTKDNRSFEADHVIVTVSLGVLKAQYETLFTPKLPWRKVEAIKAMGFGKAGKVYLSFEEPFWLTYENVTHFRFIWTDADWKAYENDPEKMWLLGVEGAQPVEHKDNLLEFYVVSKWATAMERVPEKKVYRQTVELLKRFLGKKYDIPKPIAMTRTLWNTNPRYRGTYSYRSIESDGRYITPSVLQEPIVTNTPIILFAGEATSEHRYSTADGAIESGWEAANSLINLYQTAPTVYRGY